MAVFFYLSARIRQRYRLKLVILLENFEEVDLYFQPYISFCKIRLRPTIIKEILFIM